MLQNLTNFLGGQKAKLVAIFLGLYLTSAGFSWAAASLFWGPIDVISPISLKESRARIDPNAPKTEVCPLNGVKYSKGEREVWEKRRPLTVMIENHEESRPQSGLARADVIYEAVAEGGITRLLAVFYCGAAGEDLIIGPVRSARAYFLDWASEYGDFPLYTHVGGANRPGPADALTQIARYGWLSEGNDLNQFSIGFPTFWRDYERIGHPVATEHTMYASVDKLWETAKERGLTEKNKKGELWNSTFTPWKITESSPGGQTTSVSFSFWGDMEYSVVWSYDPLTDLYKRENGGKTHTDLNNKEQLSAANIVVQMVRERALGDLEKHILYTTTGEGKAIIFQNGRAVEGIWQKKDREGRTLFFDKEGKEISFVPGQIWVEILPTGAEVNY